MRAIACMHCSENKCDSDSIELTCALSVLVRRRGFTQRTSRGMIAYNRGVDEATPRCMRKVINRAYPGLPVAEQHLVVVLKGVLRLLMVPRRNRRCALACEKATKALAIQVDAMHVLPPRGEDATPAETGSG